MADVEQRQEQLEPDPSRCPSRNTPFPTPYSSPPPLQPRRVKREKGLFFFDGSYRPCPLAQQYIGINIKKPLQRFQLMNEICYSKVGGRLHGAVWGLGPGLWRRVLCCCSSSASFTTAWASGSP